jgi:hypothetical protein
MNNNSIIWNMPIYEINDNDPKENKVAYYLLQNGADYNRPIYYRFDNSVPIEKRDPNDKGKPMYLWDVLKEDLSEFGTSEYKYKMLIIDFLKSKDKVK